MTETRNADEIMLAAAESIQSDVLELIRFRESHGTPSDISESFKAEHYTDEVISAIRRIAAEPPDNWSSLQRAVSVAISERLQRCCCGRCGP